MKHSTFRKVALAMVAAVGLSTFCADASGIVNRKGSLGFLKNESTRGREFRGTKPTSIYDLNKRANAAMTSPVRRVDAPTPSIQFDTIPDYDYLEGPDGTVWYYTAEYEYIDVYFNEYYTEHLKKAFKFTIYDNQFNRIGVIQDDLHFNEGEGYQGPDGKWYGRDVECRLDPAISRNFFNDDDKLEFMVYHARNTPQFINHYYYSIYQLDGEKDENGNDVLIGTVEGRCVEAINYPGPNGEENFYYTFLFEDPVTWEAKDPDYVEKLNQLAFHLTTYTKANEDGELQVFFENQVYKTRVPGDTTDGIYFMSKQNDGVLYFIYSQYEKPLFIDPRGGAENEEMTPDNSLVIDVFKTTGDTPVLSSQTKIPVTIYHDEESLIYTFVSIGSVAWTRDVDMVENGTPDAPAFIVATDIAKAADLESVQSSYDIYKSDGTKLRPLADGVEAISVFEDEEKGQPLAMFVKMNAKKQYIFDFVTLYDGKLLVSIPQNNGGDPLYTSCAIVKDDEGQRQYAFEMQNFETDLKGNDYSRVAWFTSDGSLARIDRINMGTMVQASLVNMDPVSLHPDFYVADEDGRMEYAVLVKRYDMKSGTSHNEFIVANATGHYLNTSAADGQGDPLLFVALPGETNRIMMVYQAENFRYNVDLYDLPFLVENITDAGVEGVVADGGISLTYDGQAVYAPGATIEVYSTAGLLEAKAQDAVTVSSLSNGVYVIVATDADGNRRVAKIQK